MSVVSDGNTKTNECRLMVSRRIDRRSASERFFKTNRNRARGQQVGQPDADKGGVALLGS